MSAPSLAQGAVPSRWYACGRCPSVGHSCDMSRAELHKHNALVHNVVTPQKRPPVLAVIAKSRAT